MKNLTNKTFIPQEGQDSNWYVVESDDTRGNLCFATEANADVIAALLSGTFPRKPVGQGNGRDFHLEAQTASFYDALNEVGYEDYCSQALRRVLSLEKIAVLVKALLLDEE